MTTTIDSRAGILLSGLAKSYRPVRAVRDLDLVIAPGETVALLGPNGAGKTTTIDMMLGLIKPDSGTVSIFGAPPAAARQAGWVGAMLQTGAPPDHLRVREIITLMASYYPHPHPHPLPVDDVLRMTGGAEFAGQWTTRLSGGQAQRVRFAADALTGAVGGIVILLALFGGVYGLQLASSGPLFDVLKGLPSYWLVLAGDATVNRGNWPAQAWITIAVWVVVLVPVAMLAFRRSARRV